MEESTSAMMNSTTSFIDALNGTPRKFWLLYFVVRHVLFTIGLFGNIFVIFAINKFKVFHTPSYSIIVNLSVADLLGLLAVPLELVMYLAEKGVGYSYGCYILW